MTNPGEFIVRDARWPEDAERIRSVREVVFVVEQAVPPDLEWDGLDEHCMHVLVESREGAAIGTGRLTPDGRIGRMAILESWRGRGAGSRMLTRLVERAVEAGMHRVSLHAQTHALDFYVRHGFTVQGPEFEEAGIPHQEMTRELDHE